jgi:hypothetical protein
LGLSSLPLALSVVTMLALLLAAGLAWLKCGREVLPAREMFSIALYILGKLGLYRVILSNKTNPEWIRTDRERSK